MSAAKVNEYLKHVGITNGGYDVQSGVGVYLWEMKRKLDDPHCVQEMMPSYLAPPADIPEGKPVIVLDAGGTNLRRAVARLHKNAPAEITDYVVHPMPGCDNCADKDVFFDAVANLLADVLHKSADISFCFSYPLVMNSCRNGTLLQLSKQLNIAGIVGSDIVENLLTALERNNLPADKHVTLLNDSTAVLLSGKALPRANEYDTFVGFILGTGINMAYVESCGNIAKLRDNCGMSDMVVNMEASRFSMFPQGAVDEEMDRATTDPKDYIFEKMVSGKFLGRLARRLLLNAGENRLFSRDFADRVNSLEGITTEDLGLFFSAPTGSGRLARLAAGSEKDDAITCYLLLEALVERAARYCAIALCSVLEKSLGQANPYRPACVVAEGSTFWNFTFLRERILHHLWSYFQSNEKLFYRIEKVDAATLTGAAIAALSAKSR